MEYKIKVITHFETDDPRFRGDYAMVSIEINGEEVKVYGDQYHSKGQDRAEGFVDGFKAYVGEENVTVEYLKVSDYEY